MSNKLISKPTVRLVSRPVLEPDQILSFLKDESKTWTELENKLSQGIDLADTDGDIIPEIAGRICYMSFGKGRSHDEYIKHIISVGHESVFEHSYYNFMISGISRSLTHELVRHRIGVSYSQLSQRYVDESDTAFVVPPGINDLQTTNPDLYYKWVRFMHETREFYAELVDGLAENYKDIEDKTEKRKKARQAARSVLPNATETKIYFGANIRSLRHIILMRAHPAADLEIRNLFVEIFRIMQNVAPSCFSDMSIITLDDGTEGVRSEQ